MGSGNADYDTPLGDPWPNFVDKDEDDSASNEDRPDSKRVDIGDGGEDAADGRVALAAAISAAAALVIVFIGLVFIYCKRVKVKV